MYQAKANGDCKGYSISKKAWLENINEFAGIGQAFKQKLLIDFHRRERFTMEIHRKRDILRYQSGEELEKTLIRNL